MNEIPYARVNTVNRFTVSYIKTAPIFRKTRTRDMLFSPPTESGKGYGSRPKNYSLIFFILGLFHRLVCVAISLKPEDRLFSWGATN